MILRNKVAIYVPSTVKADDPVSNEAITDETISFLAQLFGGATVVTASGAWVSSDKGLIKEAVNIVYAFADELSEDIILEIKEFTYSIKQRMSQEAVSLELNGALHLI